MLLWENRAEHMDDIFLGGILNQFLIDIETLYTYIPISCKIALKTFVSHQHSVLFSTFPIPPESHHSQTDQAPTVQYRLSSNLCCRSITQSCGYGANAATNSIVTWEAPVSVYAISTVRRQCHSTALSVGLETFPLTAIN